jgi:hypothetical protein
MLKNMTLAINSEAQKEPSGLCIFTFFVLAFLSLEFTPKHFYARKGLKHLGSSLIEAEGKRQTNYPDAQSNGQSR